MNNIYLTKEQQDFASKNHNLIYSFANKNNISIDKYYGILAIGLCNAVIKYDESKGISFSTFAYTVMKNSMNQEYRTENKLSNIPEDNIVSLDNIIKNNDNENILFHEIIPDNKIVDSCFYGNVFLDEIKKSFNKKELEVFDMISKEYTQSEISRIKKCSKQAINQTINSIRKKIKENYNNTK